MKYVLVIDFKAKTKLGFSYVAMESKNLIGAITEGNKLLENTEDVYMAEIAEKEGKTEKVEDYKLSKFRLVLENRGHGWNPTGNPSVIVEHTRHRTWENYKQRYAAH